jgi:endonuclease YncB( thermonuclease family)
VVVARWRLPQGSDQERYHDRLYRCVRVVDGDTIDIDVPDGRYPHTRIRLWGVDTPETVWPGQPPMYFGPEASAFTRSCVEGANVRVELSPGRSRDKYSRLLAYIYFGDPPAMLNEELIVRGYGYADRRFDHPWKTRFVQLEERAQKERQGLWAGVKPEQMPAWRQRYDSWRSASQPSAN